MGEISDFVEAGFSGVTASGQEALAAMDALLPLMEKLTDEEVALALAGVAKATADKRSGAAAMKIAKALLPVVTSMLGA